MNTAVYYSSKFLEHDPGPDHPETPSRLTRILNELSRTNLFLSGKCTYVEPTPAERNDLELAHEPDYIDLLQKACRAGGGVLDLGDTIINQKSCEVAALAVGAVKDAVNAVFQKKAKNAFALVRPPGHHAGAYYAMGFCLYNNVAVAALHLLKRLKCNRILILDIDAHHGNGTQEIFYGNNKVLYISIHEDPAGFPGTGFLDEIGEAEGIGYTVNVPLPFKTDDVTYQKALDEIAIPIATQFKPEFILVSAGFDGHYSDPVGALSLSTNGYEETFRKIVKLAAQLCEGKLVATLEGGYSINFLGKMASSAIAQMAHASYRARDTRTIGNPRTVRRAEQVINDVRRIQSAYWNL